MSLMSSLPYSIAKTLLYVVLFPWTHIAWPCMRLAALVVQHSVLIPILLIIRTCLFGLVYLPLVPVLFLINVEFDTTVPVEKALYNLVSSAWPHFKSLVGNLFHYVMVSVFLGTTAGIVAGINISIASKILRLPEQEADDVRRRDLSYMEHASDFIPGSLYNKNHPFIREQKPGVFKGSVLKNAPRVSSSSMSNPVVKEEDLSVSGDLLYEDDDGYNFMSLAPEIETTPVQSHPTNKSLLATTIIEESESENLLDQPQTSSSHGLRSGFLDEGSHDNKFYSTGFSSPGSVFSSPVDEASTGASEIKERQTHKATNS